MKNSTGLTAQSLLLLARVLAKAIGALSPEQRAVVELTFYRGFSYREVAEIVGCPVNTVKTRMFHARRRLSQLLPEFGTGYHPVRGEGFR